MLMFRILLFCFLLFSCSDEVDQEHLYVFRPQNISQYVRSDSRLTLFSRLMDRAISSSPATVFTAIPPLWRLTMCSTGTGVSRIPRRTLPTAM